MKQVQHTAQGSNFTAITVGKFAQLNEYAWPVAQGIEIPGKVFLGKELRTTGAEISFQFFAPGQETGFLHLHQNHEEIYLFVSGEGEFQTDGEVFPVAEGSVVRVAPKGRRSVRNNGTVPLIMICIQYKAETFKEEDARDGEILQEKVEW